MKAILIAAILLGTTSAFAGERRDHIRLCNNLTAINSISEVQLRSLNARSEISSTYMQIVLNQFLSNLMQVESLTNGKDALVLALKQDVVKELEAAKVTGRYYTLGVKAVFKSIAVDSKLILRKHSCL